MAMPLGYTEHDIEWRESEIADVVKFLDAVNPHGFTAEKIKQEAIRSWLNGNCKPTFIGTGGWYVSIVPKGYESEKPFIALVSIQALTALHALKNSA